MKYANDSGFSATNPAKAWPRYQNTSGKYTQPTAVDVASALAYATQETDGTHELNFNGRAQRVQPLHLQLPVDQDHRRRPENGAALSGFVNYALTLGQEASPSNRLRHLGLSLERYGIDQVMADVPGAVARRPRRTTGTLW